MLNAYKRKGYFVLIACGINLFLSSHLIHAAQSPGSKGPEGPGAKSEESSPSNVLMPQLMGVKTWLEDLLVKRYSQDLASFVDRQAFSLSAQIELAEQMRELDLGEDEEFPPDLSLGSINVDDLTRKFSLPEGESLEGFLRNFRFLSVTVSVGLRDSLGKDVKSKVESWLTQRLNQEFGKVGKGTVSYIQEPTESKSVSHPKTLLDWLSQFQNFAGQLVLALAILIGIILWKLLTSKEVSTRKGDATAASSSGGAVTSTMQQGGVAASDSAHGKSESTEVVEDSERQQIVDDISHLTQQVSAIYPQIASSEALAQAIRAWCQGGEEGLLKLACFVEVLGKDAGKLPIPADFVQPLSRVFLRMPEVELKSKRSALQKAHWDLIAVNNLGPEAIQQPFGYLSGLKTTMIDQVLMDQNPKLKALVCLYLPAQLRKDYFRSLTLDTKKSLLEGISEMTEISSDDLSSLDNSIRLKLSPKDTKNRVSLDSGLEKLVSSLLPIEEMALLSSMKGPVIEAYKRSKPSLAFIGLWKKAPLKLLLSKATPDEVITLIRVRPELKDLVLGLCPQMTVEVASDELQRADQVKEKEKNAILDSFLKRIEKMVSNRELDLEDIFSPESGETSSSGGQSPAQNAAGSTYDDKKAA